KAGGA
ncbi:hypothetical protein S40285_10938, partial [Stachybotrys chlorohalonatus IBT 40285]